MVCKGLVKRHNQIFDWNAIHSSKKITSNVFMSSENGIANMRKIWWFFLNNLESYSQIPLLKWKAQLQFFCCSQVCVKPMCQNPLSYLPSLELAMHCAPCPSFRPDRVNRTLLAPCWVIAGARWEEPLPWWHKAGGGRTVSCARLCADCELWVGCAWFRVYCGRGQISCALSPQRWEIRIHPIYAARLF